MTLTSQGAPSNLSPWRNRSLKFRRCCTKLLWFVQIYFTINFTELDFLFCKDFVHPISFWQCYAKSERSVVNTLVKVLLPSWDRTPLQKENDKSTIPKRFLSNLPFHLDWSKLSIQPHPLFDLSCRVVAAINNNQIVITKPTLQVWQLTSLRSEWFSKSEPSPSTSSSKAKSTEQYSGREPGERG